MTALEELVESANRLCNNLDVAAQNEKKYCVDLCLTLENYSHQIFCMANNINNLKNNYGG